MVRRPPTRRSVAVLAGLAVGVLAWTALVVSGWAPLAALDARLVAPPLDPTSPTAQVAATVAMVTWPGVLYAATLGVAVWAQRHRLRQLAVALALVPVIAWGGVGLIKIAVRRPRPDTALDLITTSGFAYPSGHLVAVVACSVAVGATLVTTRQSRGRQYAWQLGAAALVLLVALDRWLLGAHWVSDLVGGALYGGFAAVAALLLAGVRVPLPQVVPGLVLPGAPAAPVEPGPARTCAVIYNPARITDWATFRRHVDYELETRGWRRAIWLETTVEDPGHGVTRQAVAAGVDLVLGAGGDGTIRIICAGLARSGIPFGLIPAGTGNLLARNLGVPLDEAAALRVAFDGVDTPTDLVRLTVDDTEAGGGNAPEASDHFAVMAGVGIDAVIMQSTNPDLKKAVGSAAYFVSAARNANHPATHATVTVDDQPPLRRKASVIVVGNVGFLQAGIPLIPDARADDGLLDVLVASPRSPRDWPRLIARVIARRSAPDDQLARFTGRRVRIEMEEREPYQMDGDTVGDCRTMAAEVVPGALLLRLPDGRT